MRGPGRLCADAVSLCLDGIIRMIPNRRAWYAVHKWMSIFTGAAVLMWLVTGLVMTVPDLFRREPPAGPPLPAPPDYREITMSPAEATARLREIAGRPLEVSAVRLRQIRGEPAYQIILKDGGSHLVGTREGREIRIDPALAAQIAGDAFPEMTAILQIDRLDRPAFDYYDPEGYTVVPVYRIALDDERRTHVHVAIHTGEVVGSNDRQDRIRMVFSALHTFEAFRLVLRDRDRLVAVLLWLSSIVTILAAAVGYYLALPRAKRAGGRAARSKAPV